MFNAQEALFGAIGTEIQTQTAHLILPEFTATNFEFIKLPLRQQFQGCEKSFEHTLTNLARFHSAE